MSVVERESALVARTTIEHAADTACRRIAPLWPLTSAIAVNPYLGLTDRPFDEALALMRRVAQRVPTVSETLDDLAHGDRIASRTAFMIDELSRFFAAYFDRGTAAWPFPWRDLPLYTAWRRAMEVDRSADVMGIRGFRRSIASLPESPLEAIAAIVQAQEIPNHALTDYLHHTLLGIAGWAGHARYRQYTAELYGAQDDTPLHVLAIRLSFGYALFAQHRDDAFVEAWKRAMLRTALEPSQGDVPDPELLAQLRAQEARERDVAQWTIAALADARGDLRPASAPPVQAVFCIDVRSEIYRRAFEAVLPGTQTLGFAGFFGLPVAVRERGSLAAHCPALVAPTLDVTLRAEPQTKARPSWHAFARSIAAFPLVEIAGTFDALSLLHGTFSRPRAVAPQPEPHLDAPLSARIDLAENMLRGMSLVRDFAPYVLFVGHTSTSENNPYASALACGACGGRSGELSARLAASLLNEREVRDALRERGIAIPEQTRFLAAVHDTTTDEIALMNDAPAMIVDALRTASRRARDERAPRLNARSGEALLERASDWAQTRPEWGLAGNAAFIAAPRARDARARFDGRVFLHEYDHTLDADGAILESIMTAPLIVAHWINLQYLGSAADPDHFGSGTKMLHNVVAGIGVIEGNSGDLRAGLPLQSVHDGEHLVHEPLRLSAYIDAPLEAIDRVLNAHPGLRRLFDHRWMWLYRIGEHGATHRYARGAWEPIVKEAHS